MSAIRLTVGCVLVGGVVFAFGGCGDDDSNNNANSNQPTGVDLEAGLVAHYPLDGHGEDVSGYDRHGVVQGAVPAQDRHGVAHGALAFDGDDLVVVSGDDVFNMRPQGFTVALWVRLDAAAQLNSYPSLVGFGGYSDNGWDVFYGSGDSLAAAVCTDTDESCSRYVGLSHHQGQWVHYAVTYREGTLRGYRNGGLSGESHCPDYTAPEGLNFVIGASARYSTGNGGIVATIDDVRVYDRALNDLELATLAEDDSALAAAQKGTVFHSDFEDGDLEPEQHGYGLGLEGVGDDAIRVVDNPAPDAVNASDYVMQVSTVPSVADSHTRAEYFTKWDVPFLTQGRRHIYQWMVYFPSDYLVGIDEIRGDWHLITQFVTDPCARYPRQTEYEHFADGRICYGGGIFNEIRIDRDDHGRYLFQYRADPDCAEVPYEYPRGEWLQITYDIFWTTGSDGFYAAWVNQQLVGSATGVRTLPEGFVEGACDIRWKVGLYDSWTDADIESVSYYLDNLELYIDRDLADVCPGCAL